jgi:D-xylose transport system substrate-binding protein
VRVWSSACSDNGDTTGPVALLNGSPTDNNATLFKQGYETVIKDAGYEIAADQSVPEWDNTKAGTDLRADVHEGQW